MRERIFDDQTVQMVCSYDAYNGDDFAGTYESFADDTVYHVMHDIVTEDFYSKSARGAIINNPMDSTRIVESHKPCNFVYTSGAAYRSEGQTFNPIKDKGYLPLINLNKENDKNMALTRAWANVSESEAAALVTIAEAEKTVMGLVDVFFKLRKIIRAVRRLQFSRLKKELSPHELMDFWLQIRYGVRPLAYDIVDIIRSLQHNYADLGSRQTFRGYRFYKDDDSDQDVAQHVVGSSYTLGLNRTVTAECVFRAGVLCELERHLETDIWGLLDVPQAVLDLTTFSFVVGWFFNIADIVSSWTPSAAWKALTSWVVVETTTVQRNEIGSVLYCSPTKTIQSSDGYAQRKVITKERFPNPMRDVCPRINVNLDVFKLIDIVALSRIVFRTIPRVRNF